MNDMPNKDIMQSYMKQAMKMYKSYSRGKNADDTVREKSEDIPKEAAYPEENKDIPTENTGGNDGGMGKLIVNVSSVRGLYPVIGAEVTVFTGSLDRPDAVSRMISDENGKTGFSLPAPPKYLSETPDSTEQVYALYNVSVRKDGYLRLVNTDVPIFADTSTVLDAVLTAGYAADNAGDIVINGEEQPAKEG